MIIFIDNCMVSDVATKVQLFFVLSPKRENNFNPMGNDDIRCFVKLVWFSPVTQHKNQSKMLKTTSY